MLANSCLLVNPQESIKTQINPFKFRKAGNLVNPEVNLFPSTA